MKKLISMKADKLLIVFAMLAVCLVSCKPTEKNYKAAYDAAKAKREKAMDDDLIPEGGLLQDDGARPFQLADGRRVGYLREPVKEADDSAEKMKYYVVVGAFKMRANAAGMMEQLKKEGDSPCLLKQSDEKWYVAAAGFINIDETSAYVAEYLKKHKDAEYIGLDGTPLILESSRWRPTR